MTQPQGLTQQLAQFVAQAARLQLDAHVKRIVCTGFVDTAAVIVAGRNEQVTQIVRQFVRARQAPGGQASILFGDERTSARDSALVNATAGHALDYDDVALQGHPSVVLVPALLAEGERLQARGDELLRAYVVGYEVWAELLLRDPDLHHIKGWHPTGVFGVVAAAAAVCALRGVNENTARHALGLAASMAGGLIANFGTMAKPFHAGQAAAHGIDAADLAQAGMTAAPDALEHHAGYLAALSPKGRVSREPAPAGFGQTLRIAELALTIKKYPLCFGAHRILDATLDLAREHGLTPADVESVQATTGVAQASMLRNHTPTNALEAKFSLEFAVAAALDAGKVGLAELSDSYVRRPEVQQIFSKVRIATTDTVCPYEPTLALSDRIVIHTRDGRQLDSGEVERTRGDAATPLSDSELETKFMDCCAYGQFDGGRALFDTFKQLPRSTPWKT